MKNLISFVAFCLLCCGKTAENRFHKIESIASNYRHDYMPDVLESDSVFFLVVFFEDSLKNKMLINANDVEIPHFLVNPQSNNSKNVDPYKGYVEFGKNFFFIYDFTPSTISKEYFNTTKSKTDISNNKSLQKYDTNDYFLDSHTDIYSISNEFEFIK